MIENRGGALAPAWRSSESAVRQSLARVQQDAKRTKARLAELEKSEARLNNFIAQFEAERRRP